MFSEAPLSEPFSKNYDKMNWWVKIPPKMFSETSNEISPEAPIETFPNIPPEKMSPEGFDTSVVKQQSDFNNFIDSIDLKRLDLSKAERIRSQLIKFGTVTTKRETIRLVERGDFGALEQLKEMFGTNEVLAIDTEYMSHINPHKQQLCYIQIGGVTGTSIFIIGKLFFDSFQDMFFHWLKKPLSILLGFYLMVDLTILSTQFQIAAEEFEWESV